MTIQSLIGNVLVQTGANIISNLSWFVVIYCAVKTIVKEVPHWLEKYELMRNRQRMIDNARLCTIQLPTLCNIDFCTSKKVSFNI